MNKNHKDFKNLNPSNASRDSRNFGQNTGSGIRSGSAKPSSRDFSARPQTGTQPSSGQKNAGQSNPPVDRGQHAPSRPQNASQQGQQQIRRDMENRAAETASDENWEDQAARPDDEFQKAQERSRKEKKSAGFEEEQGVKEDRNI